MKDKKKWVALEAILKLLHNSQGNSVEEISMTLNTAGRKLQDSMYTKNSRGSEMDKSKRHRDKKKVYSTHVHLLFGMCMVVSIFMLLVAGVGVVSATDYYVATWGDDSKSGTSLDTPWQHPSYAAQQAVAGDTIYLLDDTWYSERVIFANSGTATKPIVMKAYNGTPTLEGTDDLTGEAIRINEKSYIELEGITVLKYRDGITVTNSHHVIVENCTVGILGWSGISLLWSDHCEVTNCTTYNGDMFGIWVGGGHDNIVADCWSYNNPDLSPSMDYCYSGSNTKYLTVTRCRGENAAHGICFTNGGGGPTDIGCSYIVVTDSEMYNCWDLFGVRNRGHHIQFVNCYAESPTPANPSSYNHGFYFRTGANNITVKNCRVKGVMHGLHSEYRVANAEWGVAKDITFENCIAEECIYGLVANAENTKFLNCVSTRNDKNGIWIFENADELMVKNCIISENKEAGVRNWYSIHIQDEITYSNVWGNTPDYSWQGKGASPGLGCKSEDPLFADPSNGDFHLKKDSPCIDTGDPSSAYTHEPNPNGGQINMGAYGNTAEATMSGPSGPDTNPPYTTGYNPAKNATDVAKDSSITVHIRDDGDGVDQSSIEMTVEGVGVTPTITGNKYDYTLTYTASFNYSQVVNVAIKAEDLASPANAMPPVNYAFTIESEPTTPPEAFINSITPDPAEQGKDTVSFSGHGNGINGSIVAYNWSSSMDGKLSAASTFGKPASELSAGTHAIYFKVQDDLGAWSTEVTDDLTVIDPANQPPYTPAGQSPSDGVTDVPVDAVLCWTGGDPDAEDTVTYDVYFGTNTIPALVAEDQPGTTYDPGTQDYNTEYYWRIVAKDNHGAFSESEVWSFTTASSSGSDLAAEWHLDDGNGTIAVDTSGNGNNGTLVNNPAWVTGKIGNALEFDGTNDYVVCGQESSLKITGAITVEAWVNWTGAGNPYLVTKTGGPSHRSFDLSGNTGGTVEFRVGGADGNSLISTGTISIPADEWVHLVGTYEPSSYVRLFVDGALATESTSSIPASQGDNGLPWYIGAREGNQGWFNGIIDGVKIYNGALSPEEVRAEYEAGASNLQPTAFIDSITPDPAEQGRDTVSFTGHGTDTDGSVVAYNWSSSIDGLLGTASSFSKPASELSVGTHTVYFKVQDDDGAWSTEVTEDLTILELANQLPYKPANPSPSDGATNVPIDAVLSWTGGDPDAGDTVTYDVYFGTSISPPLVAKNQPGTTYEPGMLDYSTEYYWQIVASDNHGASTGSEVWSFATASAPGSDLVAEWHLDEGSGPTTVDTSGNGNDGTIYGAGWTDGKLGKGLSFDGTDDYVNCGQGSSLKITGAITVEAWVKWTGASNPYFVTKFGGPSRRSFDLSGNTDGTVEFRVGGADCNSLISTGTISIPADEWVHLAGTYEPSSYVRLFVDGALAKENTAAIPASQGDNGLPWYIGAREGNQGCFNGTIDEVKIYNRALSAEEIRAHYDGGSTNQPPVADLNNPYIGTEGVPIHFNGSGSYDPDGTIVAYEWTFGDGNNATEVNPTHTYAQNGTYTVTLTVTDNEGATDTSTTTADIEPDLIPPYTTGHNPAKDAIEVAKNTTIVVHVKDDGAGVDITSIVMRVNGITVTPIITGTPADYTLTYVPSTDFECGQVVNVTVDAHDLATAP